ncbi:MULTISPECIES: hypothetical protein [Actinoalloteichus]|uniref:Uncharacterized protein n=1 Tax=Actinoalloteichus fjordicus TaxID=1612552 RepID=A0AAC9LBJ3_9PSEU|nr:MULTISPECIES: hypothetical protein [Actinoalloteichus]APU14913.1 hypothetical protein UA74_14275 [Actinoalloteichus fjordicus]APU20883.1 hypothetical protein UA75_14365 [Actinoalloteichus sp. GBA129-24]
MRRLPALAEEEGRPTPRVTVGLSIGLGDVPASMIDVQVRSLTEYGISAEAARRSLVTGHPAEFAKRLGELADAGVSRVIGMPFTEDRMRQTELLAESARLLGD